jgi:hypothetical protein
LRIVPSQRMACAESAAASSICALMRSPVYSCVSDHVWSLDELIALLSNGVVTNVGFLAICIALGFLIYVTLLFIRDLRTGSGSFLRKFGRCVKNVIDSLFGLG